MQNMGTFSFSGIFTELPCRDHRDQEAISIGCTDGLVLLYAEARDGTPVYYVGNPLTQEWFRIPPPHCFHLLRLYRSYDRFSDTGLVTKMRSGVVVSYKVVWWITYPDHTVDFKIYSSDTELWDNRTVTCLVSDFWFDRHKPIALNGFLHWLYNIKESFIAYDFYGGPPSHACLIVEFPNSVQNYESPRFGRTLSISEGSIVYFNEYHDNGNRTFRVWRLVDYTDGPDAWQLFREVSLVSLVEKDSYFPMAMHPLNSEIIYLWSRTEKGLILFNMRTHVCSVRKETAEDSKCMDGCILSFNNCSEYMSQIRAFGLNHQRFSQYVLPRWLHRLPRPQPT